RILVVDDEPLKRITLQIELSEAGYEVFEAADPHTAERILASRPIDIVISDVRMPGKTGLDLLAHIKQAQPEIGVILMTAYATIDTAVLAIKRGAFDYITKPFTTAELLERIARLEATRPAARAEEERDEQFGRLVARNRAMRRLFAQLRGVAETDRTLLICGESGCGKELFAEAVHAAGSRADKPFVRFSCAALQPTVLESELFGHERGAFTGAIRQKAGRFELADGGTMLLDEVDDIPAELQVKLLRVVEQQEFERVGGEESIKVDVRLICATKRDLLQMTREGRFREDLYYRLNVISVNIPPLRARLADIPVLVEHFVAKHGTLAGDTNGRSIRITPEAMEELLRHHWPGNVRELEHVVERALAFCGGEDVRPEHILPLTPDRAATTDAAPASSDKRGLTETVSDIEKRMIVMA
ncbi:MAG: sigma-54-dependent Fis family transcriptional regulator, partial [Planctomycetales bacterium]|nr:sigma-54-dependent Fis family transcriptional regulator [Planctomycetales bacterium]